MEITLIILGIVALGVLVISVKILLKKEQK
jgi:hypothetical protein